MNVNLYFHISLFCLKKVLSEAVAQGCSLKKVFLEISQNSQENTCARVSFLIKLHTRKVGPKTLRWDSTRRTLGWDPKVAPLGGTLG